MKSRYSFFVAFALVLTAAVWAQDSAPAPGQNARQNSGQGSGGGYGPRGGGFGGGMGRGTMGTVTEVAADHYTIKTDAGDVYTVRIDANTRIMKQPAGGGMRAQAGDGQSGNGQSEGRGEGMGGGMGRGTPPEQIKAADIKAGDMIRAMGDVDATTKSIAARAVMQLDAAMVQQIKAMEANFGKTWLAGKVTAIDGAKITLTGAMDNAPHTVVADENTTFRKRRDPITLADIQVGDMVRVEGSVKDGVFAATTINTTGGESPSGPRNPPTQ
jgi:hypothetical protein